MDTRKRALSALAGTGLALLLGAGMAVAAGGVFTVPDQVLQEPSSSPTPSGDAPRAKASGAADGGQGVLPTTPPPLAPIEPSPTPLSDKNLHRANPAVPPQPVPVPVVIAPSTPPPASEDGNHRDCRSARNGNDARNCSCDDRARDGNHGPGEHQGNRGNGGQDDRPGHRHDDYAGNLQHGACR